MSTLGEHQGSGIRFDMHLSAPNGGVAKMLCRPEGQWVSWNEYEKLKAEVERLRKAGDAVSLCLEAFWKGKPYDTSTNIECFDAWSAAKENKPSV